jgi:DnaD/phage-associated family protein
LRAIEKEAYHWAEDGIDTLEAAAAYIHRVNLRNSRVGKLMGILQIRGRSLTAAEEKYATKWLEMGFTDELLTLAYERTCLNTGALSWPYMDKVLQRWKSEGCTTAEQVRSAGRRTGGKEGPRQLDADEQAAIAKMLQEG